MHINRRMIAVWTVGTAFVLTLLLSSVIEPGVSPLFLIAVMVSAWRGGSATGLLATFLSALASAFVFLPPRYSLQIDLGDLLQLAVFTIAAVSIGTLSAARKREQTAREELLVKEQEARLDAERASRVKDEFLAAVSHELRTPLTTIKTLTRVLQRRELTEEERSQYLDDLASECDREIDLVLNLLDVSRMRAGGMSIELRQIDVLEAVQACKKLVQGEAERMDHRILIEVVEDLPPARADASALRRALCAIIENSIKFAPRGGSITMSARQEGECVTITIADQGRGIAERDLPHIFEKFYRGGGAGGARPSAEEVPGIGLGLNLALTLVEGMNGTIDAESRLGEGSRFVVRLPIWNDEAAAANDPLQALIPAGERVVLTGTAGGR